MKQGNKALSVLLALCLLFSLAGAALPARADSSPTDYTETLSPSPVQAVGIYTLTATGKGSYKGSKSATFSVVLPVTSAADLKNGDRIYFSDTGDISDYWRVLSPAG
ncbi:MAG: hypothetical protein E7425_14375 [Ruminococcaceae bacterium]|nr:hypothetical protein [Oscillospiraceae bacterium]